MISDSCPPTPRVPPELIDTILDHLHSDKKALANCSLVSKTFLPSSRYHLFAVVSLTVRNTQGFIGLLDLPQSTVAHSVRHLRLRELMQLEHPREKWMNKGFPVLAALESIETLYMEGVIWRLVSPQAQRAFVSGFKNLRNLHIEYIAFLTGADLAGVMAAYPSLETIKLVMVIAQTAGLGTIGDKTVPLPKHAPPRLRSLDFESCQLEHFLNWFLSLEHVPSVENVRFLCGAADQMPPLTALVKALGHCLLKLHVVCSEMNVIAFPVPLYGDIDLTENTKLRSLHIDMSRLDKCRRLLRPMQWVPTVLSRITSTHLQEIIFTINNSAVLDPSDWAEITRSLAHKRFLCLQRIQFWVSGDGVEDEIKAMLASCSARSVMKIN